MTRGFKYLLAQREDQINLARVDPDAPSLNAGDTFVRMPRTEQQTWTVLKVFEGKGHQKLEALELLMGYHALMDLFKIPALAATTA